MTGMITGPILVEPDSDFMFEVETDEFSVDVEGSELLIQFLEGICAFPEEV